MMLNNSDRIRRRQARGKGRVPESAPSSERILTGVVLALIILTPLWVATEGRDSYRFPKLLLLRLGGLVLLPVLVSHRQFWRTAWLRYRPVLLFCGSALAWTLLAAIFSSDHLISTYALVTAVSAAIFFLACVLLFDGRNEQILGWLFLPAVITTVMVFLQLNLSWNRAITGWIVGELPPAELMRASPTALLGNRNDVGCYLVVPALLALVMTIVRRKPFFALLTVVLVAGLVLSSTVTAIAAFLTAVLLVAFLRSWRVGVTIVAFAPMLLAVALFTNPPLQQKAALMRQRAVTGDYDAFFSRRFAGYLAAAEMVRQHPITGVGPGCFGKNYFAHRIDAADRYQRLLPRGASTDLFVDAHNDHLQVAAECGLPSLLFLWSALWFLGRRSFVAGRDEVRRLLSLPLAGSFAVLALALSPLQLAATIVSYAFTAAFCMASQENS